jgi:hypothetical protein
MLDIRKSRLGTNTGKTSVSLPVDLYQRLFADPVVKDIFDQFCVRR